MKFVCDTHSSCECKTDQYLFERYLRRWAGTVTEEKSNKKFLIQQTSVHYPIYQTSGLHRFEQTNNKKCVLSLHFNPAHIWPNFPMFHEFNDCHLPFPMIFAILAPGLLFYGPKYIWSVANISIWGKIKRGIIEKVHIDHPYFECQMWHCIHVSFFEFFVTEVKFVCQSQICSLTAKHLKNNV